MFDKVLLVLSELVPVLEILSKIDFFSGPEASHLFFVHLPYVVVSDWEDDKSIWILFKKRFWQWSLGLSNLSLAILGDALIDWNL
jgi:hypothetical protein